jgi:cytoskeletal protein CcmA (bactofilin family)
MAVFGTAKGNGSGGISSRAGGREPNLSVLAAGMRITGALETDGFLRIEGTVEGDLRAEGQVLISAGGLVEGDIQAGGRVNGDISTPRIAVEEGGAVNGQLRMSEQLRSIEVAESAPIDEAVPAEAEEYGRLRSVN